MDPIQINETRQDFNGERFFKCGAYYSFGGLGGKRRLHRVVWEYHNGPIPKGHHIHHIDGNTYNNNISNLECLSATEHAQHHHKGVSRPFTKQALEAAARWHRSPEGMEWHKNNGKSYTKVERQRYTCVQCNEAFLGYRNKSGTCGQTCRKRLYEGLIGPPKRRNGRRKPMAEQATARLVG